ncbi:endonuclease exonuclease phosphatase family protein [Babesia ovis]|uniref:sphingomyelin phosphodiesterase n=1 Tax=Babesia ovis TaxID=5869 RepID=A0A9W5T9L1_BABOV|nr:endonuclease exonuclease phosphatase family protein [Babesia ovis]
MTSLQTVRVMSYNVEGIPAFAWPQIDHDVRTSSIAKYILAIVKKYKVDVLILQEVFTFGLYNKIKDELSGFMQNTGVIKHASCKSSIMRCIDFLLQKFNLFTSGIVIFSKYPIVNKERMLYSHGIYMDAYSGKGAIAARLSVNGRPLDVIGTHLQSWEDDEAHEIRKKQVAELTQWLGETIGNYSKRGPGDTQPYTPMVLAGDLNCSVKDQKELFEQLLHILEDKVQESFGSYTPQATYSTLTNDFCAFQNKPNVYNHVYDYILKDPRSALLEPQTVIRDKLEVPLLVERIDKSTGAAEHSEMYNVSDHLPIMVTIGI